MKSKVIISQPFNRREYSFLNEDGTVQYSGSLYNNKGSDLMPDEYLKINAHRYTNPTIVDEDVFFDLYQKEVDNMKTLFKEISEEQYIDALECLPPKKWHNINKSVNVFFISEATINDLHSCYIKSKGKYYSALRSIFESDEQLLETFLKSIE
jgi:hypothetical protein